jgi:ABC-type antimicrobial peptide transport system permease subunit
LVDYGLTVDHVQRTFEGATTHDYIQLASDQMMLSPATVEAARRAWKKYRPQESLAYLANSIDAAKSGERPAASIPYSTVTAIDPDPRFGPLSIDRQGKPIERLEAGQIVLNSWAADDLTEQGAAPTIGSEISLSFFKPESTHGRVETETTALELSAVVPLTAPDERPQPANDPLLTPELPGVTDQASIDNWDPPFPYDNTKVRSQPPNDQDEDYWRKYKTTPKAFVSLALGRTLWASRFGDTTAVRVPASEGVDRDALAKQLLDQLDPAAGGFKFQPIKRLALAASSGTTPFEGLFLGFSMFLIVAAVMLAALLFRLGMEQRADQIGLMLALGINRSRVARLLLAESTATAAIGGILGVVGGVAYAGLMIAALEWLWIDAIRAPILHLHWTWQSLGIGYAVGVLVSAGVILWSLRRMKRQSVRSLLAGQFEVEGSDHAYRPTTARYVAVGLIVVAFASAIGALQLAGEAQAGAFMASGAAALGAILSYNWMRLRGGAAGGAISAGGAPLVRLAIRNAARFPTRSALAIGLVASASFLIVSFSAFRVDPSTGGVGGFDLIAESTQPIYYDLNNAAGRDDLGLDDETSDRLSRSSVVSIRAESGDDSSCLNLYQTEQPRVLGVPPALAGREKQFDWAASLAETKPDRENPWRLLEAPLDDGALPVALDAATALYGLHKNLGDVIEIDDRRGGVIECRIVGLLKNSLFQGAVMMSEKNFLDQFPEASGYQMFLIDVDDGADSKTVASTAALVNAALADEGFFALRADARLADFLAVQNTYLSTFQSLGALGLLLGTLGLATVELRSVWQRRGELALMRAVGFRQSRLVVLVTLENAALLLAGLASGVAAALVAVVPHIFAGGANIPWTTLGGMLAAILAIGIAAGLLAVRTIVGRPLLAALRGE